MTNDCLRCGKCCRSMGMKIMGLSPEVITYLIARGCTIDDAFILIPHRCQHLKVDVKQSEFKVNEDGSRVLIKEKYMCDIHDKPEYPIICKRFHGHGTYFIPEGCVYATPKGRETELQLLEKKKAKSIISTITKEPKHSKHKRSEGCELSTADTE